MDVVPGSGVEDLSSAKLFMSIGSVVGMFEVFSKYKIQDASLWES